MWLNVVAAADQSRNWNGAGLKMDNNTNRTVGGCGNRLPLQRAQYLRLQFQTRKVQWHGCFKLEWWSGVSRKLETIEGSRELETIKQNERGQQRARNDHAKRKRAAESLKRSNKTKEGSSRELEPIKQNARGQQRA